MSREIPKIYNAREKEDEIYNRWEKSGFFNPDKLPGKRKEIFSIAMPPPNATGVLHTGHAMFLTLQDAIIRFQRMLGKKTLWLPGTDHAAIATQTKVEKILQEEGKTKHDLGREKFLKRVEEFVKNSQGVIRKQIRKMGSSCDWSRERFTLDEGLSRSAREAFVRMYHAGLIYRGERIVNWCPRCESTLSDDEIEYREEKTHFYYFRYGPVVIGTARPETKVGDKALVVHPDDKRYKHLHNTEIDVEWLDRRIRARVIADAIVDPKLGSGAMTITPAHDFIDFDLAQKYHIPIVKIIDEKGKMTSASPKALRGMDARQARKKVVEILQSKGLVDHIDRNYIHNLSLCYRCDTPIEPLVKDQWFVDVNKSFRLQTSDFRLQFPKKEASLKELALWVVKSGQIEIIPKRFEKIYFHWMENLRDWCISRQIWYGHRIPVWHKAKSQIQNTKLEPEVYVGVHPPEGNGWLQDPDTLDTWFSSGLWTFSTLNWPAKTKDLKTFHPTDLMETGYDILFFWVARMILLSSYLMKEPPFRQVYLHGLVRDEEGRKMSKSLGNIIDPLKLIAAYGADSLRLSLLIGITPGNDVILGEKKIEGYRNFINKLWNISRFALESVREPKSISKPPRPKTLADAWILCAFHELIKDAEEKMKEYQFSHVGEKIYEFTWSKFADWYIEIAKIEKHKDGMLNYIVSNLLKLWHPFCPYITEEIWKHYSKDLLMIERWPSQHTGKKKKEIQQFSLVMDIISAIRTMRSENKIESGKKIDAMLSAGRHVNLFKKQKRIIEGLARLKSLRIEKKIKKPDGAFSQTISGIEIFLPHSGIIDTAKKKEALTNELRDIEEYIQKLKAKLENKAFFSRAPRPVVENAGRKLEEQKKKLERIQKNLEELDRNAESP